MAYEALAAAFQNGDVLYGLDVPRAEALEALKNHGIARTGSSTKIYLCGIIRRTQTRTNVTIQNDLTNAVWDPANPGQYAPDESIVKQLSDPNRGRDFKRFLDGHPKYNVANQPTNTGLKSWNRTSKAGLEFQTRRGNTVHFIMTDLINTIDQIASKTRYGKKGNITSAELRWLYRHRNFEDVKNHVRFWLKDREMQHDEVFNREEWNSYTPKNGYDADWNQQQTIRIAVARVTR